MPYTNPYPKGIPEVSSSIKVKGTTLTSSAANKKPNPKPLSMPLLCLRSPTLLSECVLSLK